jgi:hypothetical protein
MRALDERREAAGRPLADGRTPARRRARGACGARDEAGTVWVNDQKVNEGTKASVTMGAICLQSEGAEIHFRKFELTAIK